MRRSQDRDPFVTDPEEWDGRAELAIGLFLRSYLDENPAPAGVVLARDMENWSENLIADAAWRIGGGS
jgi:hypothetical protein